MNILHYLYQQETDLDDVLDSNGSQTVGSREPLSKQSALLNDAISFAKDSLEHQFDGLNSSMQTVH